MRVVANIQMEKWNGDVLDINKTIEQLGLRKCSQLIGLHALSGCDTVSYPFGKVKKSAIKLLEIDIQGLDHSVRTTWRDPRSAQGDSRQLLSTPLWTEELYGNE